MQIPGRCLRCRFRVGASDADSGSEMAPHVEDAGYIFIIYPSPTVDLTRWGISGSAAGVLPESTAITLYPVGVPTRSLLSGLREVFPQALESVKGSLICKFGSGHREYSRPTEREQCLVMKHTSSRVTGVWGSIVNETS